MGAGVSAAAPASLPSVTLCRVFGDLGHNSYAYDKTYDSTSYIDRIYYIMHLISGSFCPASRALGYV